MKITVCEFDTCGCAFKVTTDEGVTVSAEIISPPCAAHAGYPEQDLFSVILAENQSKNVVLGAVNAELPDGVDVTAWTFNEDRELLVTIPAGEDSEAAQVVAESVSQVPVTITTE